MSEYIAGGQPSAVHFRVFHGNLMLCLTRDNRKSRNKKRNGRVIDV